MRYALRMAVLTGPLTLGMLLGPGASDSHAQIAGGRTRATRPNVPAYSTPPRTNNGPAQVSPTPTAPTQRPGRPNLFRGRPWLPQHPGEDTHAYKS